MPKYVVPVSFSYEAHFVVEADSPEGATLQVMESHKRYPSVIRGSEAKSLGEGLTAEWESVTLSQAIPLEQKEEASGNNQAE